MATTVTEPRLSRLLTLIGERGEIAVEDHVKDAGISSRTALRDLSELIRHGLIQRIGIRRGARYRVAKELRPEATVSQSDVETVL